VGKVRTLLNDLGKGMPTAGPSIAAQVIGLATVPQAGDEFAVYATDSDARTAAEAQSDAQRAVRMAEMTGGGSMVTLSSLATIDDDTQEALQRINLIIKGDTSGVVEAIKAALSSLPQQSVVLRYLLSGAGDVTVSDVDLAAASGGLVLAFNLDPEEAVRSRAKALGVTINTYKVIYNLIDDVKAAMEGMLRIIEERIPVGGAEVRAVFGTGKNRVAGCAVTTGKLAKGALAVVKRGKAVVHEGKLASLRRVKDNVESVEAGLECGVGIEGFLDWAEGDVIECFQVVSKARRLEEARATTAVDIATLAA